jgi:hypothetical protein
MTSPNNPYFMLPLVDDTIKSKRKFIPRTPSNSPPKTRVKYKDSITSIIDMFNNINLVRVKKLQI